MHPSKIILVCACLGLALQAAHPQAPASKTAREDSVLARHAKGTFDVTTTAQAPDEVTGGPAIGRYALDKQFHGDLEAASKGQMLAAGDPAKGAAGYVAMEHVTGTLHGKRGEFAFQHNGTMDHSGLHLTVTVVPGSGTGELAGITGSMTIIIAAGKHSYDFDYTLPAAMQ
jgi:hypothetical protein